MVRLKRGVVMRRIGNGLGRNAGRRTLYMGAKAERSCELADAVNLVFMAFELA